MSRETWPASGTYGLISVVAVSDQLRRDAPVAIWSLKNLGVRWTIMLTGDNERTVAAVAAKMVDPMQPRKTATVVRVSAVPPELKALIDRACLVSRANDDMFRRKVGAAVLAVRRAGSTHAFDTINHFFFLTQMVVPGSCYWNVGIGREKGEVEKDAEGLRTMQVLGENMAWLLKKLAG